MRLWSDTGVWLQSSHGRVGRLKTTALEGDSEALEGCGNPEAVVAADDRYDPNRARRIDTAGSTVPSGFNPFR